MDIQAKLNMRARENRVSWTTVNYAGGEDEAFLTGNNVTSSRDTIHANVDPSWLSV